MKGVYHLSTIYRGFQIEFFFDDHLDAIKVKDCVQEQLGEDHPVRISRNLILDKLPSTFTDVVKSILTQLDEEADKAPLTERLEALGDS